MTGKRQILACTSLMGKSTNHETILQTRRLSARQCVLVDRNTISGGLPLWLYANKAACIIRAEQCILMREGDVGTQICHADCTNTGETLIPSHCPAFKD